jgi:hypothetical protein
MTSEITRSAVYERISRDPDHTAQSVRRHVKECLRRVSGRSGEGWQLISLPGSPADPKEEETEPYPGGVFVDNSISAGADASGHLKRRPEYDRLMAAVDRGEIDVIVCTAQSRLWRSTRAMLDEFPRLVKARVRVEPLKGMPLRFDDALGRAMAQLIAVFDELEQQLAIERGQGAMLDFAERGAYHGARPFGYDMTGGGRKLGHTRSLTPRWGGPDHERAAAERRRALPAATAGPNGGTGPDASGAWPDWYSPDEADFLVEAGQRITDDDHKLTKICRDFDQRGILTAKGLTWRRAGTGSLLNSLVAPRNVKVRDHKGTPHEASWPPILDEDLYARVREILTDPDRATAPGRHARVHLLAGIAVCGGCGAGLKSAHFTGANAARHGRKARYVCTKQKDDPTGKPACGGINRDAAECEEEVARIILDWLREDDGLFDAAMHEADSADARALRAEQRDLIRKRDRIAGLVTREVITEQEARDQRRSFDADIARIGSELGSQWGRHVMDAHPERGKEFAAKWHRWGTEGQAGFARRREVLSAMVDKIVIHPAPRGVKADIRLVQVYPAGWASGLADPAIADPAAIPTGLVTGERVRDWLAGRDGTFTRAQIAAGTGDDPGYVHKALKQLVASGEITREWTRVAAGSGDRVSVRSAFVYRTAEPAGRAA